MIRMTTNMARKLAALALISVALLSGCTMGTVETGNVGVVTRFGEIQPQEKPSGFYMIALASLKEYTFRETQMDIKDMKPRAKDNLNLADLDVTVYYEVVPDMIADFMSAKQGQSALSEGLGYPGWHLVSKLASGAINDQVSKFDSLTMHQNRAMLEEGIKKALQADLKDADPKFAAMFKVNRIVVTSLQTDPKIEQSIQANVQRQKELEAKEKEVEIAKKQAQIDVERAKGTANANEQLNRTLTPAYLQHQYNVAIAECAKRPSCTMFVGGAPAMTLPVTK